MPLTNKEKQARKRQKIKADPVKHKQYLEKERQRKSESRKVKFSDMNEKEKSEFRACEAKRIKEYRARKKAEGDNNDLSTQAGPSSNPYKSRQSFGKAITKVNRNLPHSPNKRKAVISKVAEQCGLEVSPVVKKSGGRKLSTENNKKVTNFFERNDISWQAPGKKDRYIYREKDETGKVVKCEVQLRYMMMSLSEAYAIFNEENPDILKFTKFTLLRPQHVKLFDSIPHNVCVCVYHENMRLLLHALHDFCELSTEFRPFIEQVVCDAKNKNCMDHTCSVCVENLKTYRPVGEVKNHAIKYFQWKKPGRTTEKIEILGTVESAFDEISEQLKHFLMHTFIKRNQAEAFEEIKANVNGNEVLMQVDFSENASLIHQNEVQAAHWHHDQATLFTAHLWIEESITESFVVVSDDLQHGKLQVFTFLQQILKTLKSKHSNITVLNIFSDGAGSQFKQRYNFASLHLIEKTFDIKVKWHFFATAHGKGVVDGIGGSVKRCVWRNVRSGKSVVTTAEEFFKVAEQNMPKVSLLFVDKATIESNPLKDNLEKIWNNAQAVPNCQSVHYVETMNRQYVIVGPTSKTSTFHQVLINSDDEGKENDQNGDEIVAKIYSIEPSHVDVTTLKKDEWVLVQYEDHLYLGIVVSVIKNDAEVSVMHPSGGFYKWPAKSDQILYQPRDIVKRIAPPEAAGTRGQFKFCF